MIKVNFSGSYYEIGFKLGEMIKNFFQLPPISKKTIDFAQECLPHVKKHAPGILDEIKGLSNATGFNQTLLEAFILALGKDMIDQARGMFRKGIDFGCSTIAISPEHTSIEAPIFARNYDWEESFKEYFTGVWNNPKDGISSLSFTDHIVGCLEGINKAGLAMSIHALPSYEREWKPGLRMNIIARWILDNFKNTKEAVQYFEKIPHICGHNYLIADKEGIIARIETAGDEVVVTYSENGFMAVTNHYETESLHKYEFLNFKFSNSHERLKKIQIWYKKKNFKVSIDDIMEVLSSHDKGVCNHFDFGGETTSTLWSWIAQIGVNEIFLCNGSPCSNQYKKMKY